MKNIFTTSHGLQSKLLIVFLLVFTCATIAQQTYTFTAATATGNTGPTQTMINAAYLSTNLNGSVQVTGGIQTFTAPYTGGYRIDAYGASGGASGSGVYIGGLGARMAGDFTLTAGTVLRILVGQQGINGVASFNGDVQQSGGTGGGGSFVTTLANVPLVVAGGGGGASNSGTGGGFNATGQGGTITTAGLPGGGNASSGGTGGGGGLTYNWTGWHGGTGGGGLTGNGINSSSGSTAYGSVNGPGIAFTNGGAGGTAGSSGRNGGFGGGGSSGFTGAGGGGYSGGGAGTTSGGTQGGGGGGSYNNGTNQNNLSAVNQGDGRVLIIELCNISITSSGPNPTNPSICSGNSLTLTTNAASNYTWSTGNTTTTSIVVNPTSSQTYSVIGTSTANCQAAAFISVIVNSVPPVLSVSNPSSNICLGRTVSLTATGAVTYTWTGGVVNGQTFTPVSTQVYTVSGQNGCGITTATTAITVAPLPVSVLATPSLICQNYPSTLTAVASVTGYTWMPGPLIGPSPIVTATSPVLYTVTASDGTCSGTQTLLLNTKTTPTITVGAATQSMCLGDFVTLSASGAGTGGTYSWTPGGSTSASFTVSPPTNTLFVVSGTNSLNCTASAQQAILVQQPPTLQVSANKTLVCSGQQIYLNASGAMTYSWTGGPATAAYTVTQTAPITIYTVTGGHTVNICLASSTIALAAITPSVNYTASVGICPGQSATLTATGATSYTWNGIPMGANGTNIVAPTQTSTFVLIANTQSLTTSCIETFSSVVKVNPNPTVTVVSTKTTATCKGQTNTLTASGAVSYSWSVGTSTANIITVNPTVTTLYNVTGTDANGCTGVNSIQLKVNSCAGIGELQRADQFITVYPNPNNGEFSLSSEFAIQLRLVNSLGQNIADIQLDSMDSKQVQLKGIANGIYFLVGENEQGKVNQKIIISK